jgi:hypothetical protein
MKLISPRFLFPTLVTLGVFLSAARADPFSFLIVGESVEGKTLTLAFENQNDNKSTWVTIGDTVGGFVFESYDSVAKVATLRHDTDVIHVGWRLIPHEGSTDISPPVNSKERWAPVIKKKFDKAEVVFFADVIPRGTGVVFRCVRVLKSKAGEPLVGQTFEFDHIDIPNVTDGLGITSGALVFLNVYPPTEQSGPQFNYFREGLFRGHSFMEVMGWISDEGSKAESK